MVTVACAGLLLASCSGPDGTDETDRQSKTLAEAISYPHQADAAGFARAALATNLGKSKDFSVLTAENLAHKAAEDPMAHLVWRIHQDEYTGTVKHTPAFDACYDVEFNYYGPSSGPSRVTCPKDAVALTPPPTPNRNIPPEDTPALEAVLGKLPATPSEADVRAAVAAGLPAPPTDPQTGLAGVPPQILVQVKGSDVGVALFAHTSVDDKDCTMGHRVGGVVKVWGLSWRDLGPLEKSCDGAAALATP
jgi:hypothetical protein